MIQLVFEEKTAIYEASKTLEINYSTAKFICKQYKDKGTVYKKKTNKKCEIKLSGSTFSEFSAEIVQNIENKVDKKQEETITTSNKVIFSDPVYPFLSCHLWNSNCYTHIPYFQPHIFPTLPCWQPM